jgi:hypothetical protein
MNGGSAKTTTAAFLAHALARAGRRVLAVDAHPAGSLLRWGDAAGWAIPVIGMPTRKIHVGLPNVADRYDMAVIDTPPLDDQAGIVYSAFRAASDVVVPVGATTMELDRISSPPASPRPRSRCCWSGPSRSMCGPGPPGRPSPWSRSWASGSPGERPRMQPPGATRAPPGSRRPGPVPRPDHHYDHSIDHQRDHSIDLGD